MRERDGGVTMAQDCVCGATFHGADYASSPSLNGSSGPGS
jgi:hypothetical protein